MSTKHSDKTLMQVKRLFATLNIAPYLKPRFDKDGNEMPQPLPPGQPVDAYEVDQYPACPTNWMNGSSLASSYFLEAEEDAGMWINFNDCFNHPHHVAVVISIQGINPITGQKTEGLRLEQYRTKCPVHNVEFQQDNFCKECGYKWPAQNYIASNVTPWPNLWLDGFRVANGEVRQYIFTAEEINGVASQIIGNDRVFAIGIAFYLSKNAKPKPVPPKREPQQICNNGPWMKKLGSVLRYKGSSTPSNDVLDSRFDRTGYQLGPPNATHWTSNHTTDLEMETCVDDTVSHSIDEISMGNKRGCTPDDLQQDSTPDHEVKTSGGIILPPEEVQEPTEQVDVPEIQVRKKLEIGAGALISQHIYPDTEELSFWQDKPAGIIYVNYCTKDILKQILGAGTRKENHNGFLTGLKKSV